MCALLEQEVEATASHELLFRRDSLAVRTFVAFLRLHARPWRECLRPFIALVSEGVAHDCELADKLLSPTSVLEDNVAHVTRMLGYALSCLLGAASQCPAPVTAVLACVKAAAAKHFPDVPNCSTMAVTSLLFLRFFIPAIVAPVEHNLAEHAISSLAQRALTITAMALQKVANMTTFPLDQPHFHRLNDWMTGASGFVHEFAATVAVAPPSTPPDQQLITWLSRSSALTLLVPVLERCLPIVEATDPVASALLQMEVDTALAERHKTLELEAAQRDPLILEQDMRLRARRPALNDRRKRRSVGENGAERGGGLDLTEISLREADDAPSPTRTFASVSVTGATLRKSMRRSQTSPTTVSEKEDVLSPQLPLTSTAATRRQKFSRSGRRMNLKTGTSRLRSAEVADEDEPLVTQSTPAKLPSSTSLPPLPPTPKELQESSSSTPPTLTRSARSSSSASLTGVAKTLAMKSPFARRERSYTQNAPLSASHSSQASSEDTTASSGGSDLMVRLKHKREMSASALPPSEDW